MRAHRIAELARRRAEMMDYMAETPGFTDELRDACRLAAIMFWRAAEKISEEQRSVC